LAGRATPGSRFGRSEGREAGLKTKKKLQQTCLLRLVVLQVMVVLAAGEEWRKPLWVSAAARISSFTSCQWRWRMEETCRHFATTTEGAQNSPALFLKLFFCNFQMLLCIFGYCCVLIYLILFFCYVVNM
jgi:hypothetical protein